MATLPPPPINDKPGSFTWLEWYRQLRNYVSTSGSVPWYIINFSGSNLTDLATRLHNNLQGLQGGTSGEQYHLTAAQHAALSAGPHNNLSGLQGGSSTERYHLTATEHSDIINSIGLLTNRSYGEMYAFNAGYTRTIAVTDIWYPLDNNFTTGTNLNCTFQNNHELKVTKAGKYHVQWSVSAEIASANQDTEWGISINNVVQTNTVAHLHFQSVNSELCAASGGIVTLAVDDVVRMVARNRTSTTSVKMEHASLTLVRIDN